METLLPVNRVLTPMWELRDPLKKTLLWQGKAWTSAQARLLATADAQTWFSGADALNPILRALGSALLVRTVVRS